MTPRRLTAWGVLIGMTVAVVQGARGVQDWRRAHLPQVQQAQKTRGGAQPVLDLVEFSDFQCPACAQAAETLHPLLARYPQQLRLQFRHHPLEKNHPWAMTAAIAAECAARQGKFWAYHDLLFARQQSWVKSADPVATLKGYATELQLRRAAFDRCLDEGATLPVVRQDQAAGDVWVIRSTPTFVINGKAQIVGSGMLKQELPAIEARLQAGERRP